MRATTQGRCRRRLRPPAVVLGLIWLASGLGCHHLGLVRNSAQTAGPPAAPSASPPPLPVRSLSTDPSSQPYSASGAAGINQQPVAVPVAYAEDIPAQRPPSYLDRGPVFNVNPDSQSPRGLADQIVQLQSRNTQLASDVAKLNQDLASVRQELSQTADAAYQAQQAWDKGQRELAAARHNLATAERQWDDALRRLERREQQHLSDLDQLIGQVRNAVRQQQESNGETISRKSP